MISVEEIRKILGEEFAGMTDEEIESFRNHSYALINELLDDFIREQEEKNKGNSR